MSDARTYLLYRLRVRSDFSLAGEFIDDEEYDLCFTRKGLHEPRPFQPTESTLRYRNPRAGVELHVSADNGCLRFLETSDFYFSDGSHVDCYVGPDVSEDVVTAFLQGPVCALLLEKRGVVALHASAVQIGDSAVAFLGDTGSGKSSIAHRLISLGCPLVTDDILALSFEEGECMAVPAFPQIKLCADMAGGLTDTDYRPAIGKHLRQVGRGWGRFADRPLPLRVAYLLHRSEHPDTPSSSESLSPGDGFAELLRLSFCANVAGKLDLEKSRFQRLSHIAAGVTVRRFRYANGEDNLNAACQYLRSDVSGQDR